MGVRERKKEETKRVLLEKASALFAEKSYQRVTTAEIARAAGIAEGTLFNYFRNKADLFIASMMPEPSNEEWHHTVLGEMSASHLASTLAAMLGQAFSGLAKIEKRLLKDYYSIVFSGESMEGAEARGGLLAADERMVEQVMSFLSVQKQAYPAELDAMDVELAGECILGCVVTLLSQYAMLEECSYDKLQQSMYKQLTFILTGHVRET